MKELLTLLLFSVLSFSVTAQTNEQIKESYPGKEIVRIMSYNIWCGFEYLKDTARMAKTAEWIKSKDPEVVALQELCSFDKQKLEEFAKMYGHNYVAIHKENGYPIGITSKRPIETISIRTEGMGHGYIHVKTYGLDLIATHLTPFNCDNRLKEAQIVTDYIKSSGITDYLVMGDLNSHSPFDAEELEQHTELVRGYAVYGEQHKDYNNIRGRLLDYSVQSHLIAQTLEDIIRLYVPVKDRMTYPAFNFAPNYKGKEYLHQQGERIDYIYASQPLVGSCKNAYVWNGEDTRFLSDHYPVAIDMLRDKPE